MVKNIQKSRAVKEPAQDQAQSVSQKSHRTAVYALGCLMVANLGWEVWVRSGSQLVIPPLGDERPKAVKNLTLGDERPEEVKNKTLGDERPEEVKNKTSLLHQIAPTVFPMDPDTGLIHFPEAVEHVLFDIGAFDSDYVKTLETYQDKNVALILVDPLPESLMPLYQKMGAYNYQQTRPGQYPNADFGDRIFVLRAALGPQEGTADFNMAKVPSCGSILATSQNNTFWCWGTKGKLRVNVFTLGDLIDLIPPSIQSIHVKVDAEGADHLVLEGASKALARVSTIVAECMPAPGKEWIQTSERVERDGQCNDDVLTKWMCDQHQFCDNKIIPQGSLSNICWWHPTNLIMPKYLTRPSLQHKAFFQHMQLIQQERAAVAAPISAATNAAG